MVLCLWSRYKPYMETSAFSTGKKFRLLWHDTNVDETDVLRLRGEAETNLLWASGYFSRQTKSAFVDILRASPSCQVYKASQAPKLLCRPWTKETRGGWVCLHSTHSIKARQRFQSATDCSNSALLLRWNRGIPLATNRCVQYPGDELMEVVRLLCSLTLYFFLKKSLVFVV